MVDGFVRSMPPDRGATDAERVEQQRADDEVELLRPGVGGLPFLHAEGPAANERL